MFCREQSIQANSNFGQVAAPIKCRSWLCPNCAEWRQKCLMSQCINGKPNRFITITCRAGQFGTKEGNAAAIVRAWRIIVQRWRRKRPWHRCQFIAVFEPHESGWPHLHVLWRGHWLDQEWLSEQTTELLNSPVAHVSLIKGRKSAAFYVAKYFSKAPLKFGTCKRYWTSQKFAKSYSTDAEPVFRKGYPIERRNQRIGQIESDWKRAGKTVWRAGKDIIGWGVLWAPTKEPTEREVSIIRTTWGLRKSWRRRRSRGHGKEGGRHGPGG